MSEFSWAPVFPWAAPLAWSSLAFVGYTYAGYAALLKIWPGKPSPPSPPLPQRGRGGLGEVGEVRLPSVSILIAACNEAAAIGAKLDNIGAMDFPMDKVEVLVGSDGSTDATDEIVRAHPLGARLFRFERLGKTAVLNRLVPHATGGILVFMDARQRVGLDALRRFAGHFEKDPSIGSVGGELALVDENGQETSAGVGVYWKYEKWLRRRESELGLLTGLSGALYALRRDLYEPPNDDAILDDVMIPLARARRGHRMVIDENIKMFDRVADEDREFRRKVRTLIGNFQTFGYLLRRPRPFPPRLVFSLVSHKVCRALTPVALLTLFMGSLFMPHTATQYLLLGAQGLVYKVGIAGLLAKGRLQNRLVSVCSTFCMLNAAAAVALFRYATGRYRTAWK